MAKKKYIDILMSGVDAWNDWRESHQLEEADFSEADLHGITLSGAYLWKTNFTQANLTNANLFKADLSGANLSGANLSKSHIREADLRNTNLYETDLHQANLYCSTFQHSDLRKANLTSANLTMADFSFANFTGADLDSAEMKGAVLAYTIFGDTNLSRVKDLGLCHHRSKSIIDQMTLRKSGRLPVAFLRGCGLPENFIKSIPALFGSQIAEKYYSCYISYSHKDRWFARRLYNVLQARGIRCWLDEEQLIPGDPIFEHLSRGIGIWDKVLFCCSINSCNSLWVERELTLALAKEEQLYRKHGRHIPILIPLNIDDYLFGDQWENGKREEIRSRLAANFAGHKASSTKFKSELEKVVKALRSDKYAREKPPKPKL